MKKEKIVIYQVLPRLFGNDKANPSPDGSMEDNHCGKFSALTGNALREIKKMGFNHIWYTGVIEHATQTDYSRFGIKKDHPAIVKGRAGSPYAVKDYYDVDPDLADDVRNRMTEFEALVERTRQAGLKVIIDFVPNHVARQYSSDAKPKGITDLGANDNIRTSFDRDNNFYYLPGQLFSPPFSLDVKGDVYRENPVKVTGNDCFSAHPSKNDWYETVKLNYGVDYLNNKQPHFSPVPSTWKKMLNILLFWAGKNVDAFRCDMAEMVPVEFWNWAIGEVKKQFEGILFIAEVYNPEQYRNYLRIGKFDYLYDKVGLYDTLKNIMINNQSAHSVTGCWQSVDDIQSNMLNFLENHDEQRIASDFFAKNPFKALPALVVSATMNSNPFLLYFGQELGEKGMDSEGFSGLDGRTTIFDYWSIESIRNWRNKGQYNENLLSEEQKELRNYYIKILQLCNQNKAIREGQFYDLMYVNTGKPDFNPHRQFAYMRCYEEELLLIVANFDDRPTDVNVFIPAHAFEYFGVREDKIKAVKELITNEKYAADLSKDSDFSVHIKGNNAVIVQFKADCRPLRVKK